MMWFTAKVGWQALNQVPIFSHATQALPYFAGKSGCSEIQFPSAERHEMSVCTSAGKSSKLRQGQLTPIAQ